VEPVTGLRENNSIIPRSERDIVNSSNHFISVLDKEADSSRMAGVVRDDSLETHPLALPHRIRVHLYLKDLQITGLNHGPQQSLKKFIRL
jgi:hypothetical protein